MIRTAGAGVRSGRAMSPGIRSPDPTSIVISSVRTSGTGVPGGTSGWHTTDLLWLGADATIPREHDRPSSARSDPPRPARAPRGDVGAAPPPRLEEGQARARVSVAL